MHIWSMNISDILRGHMKALTSIVTDEVWIYNLMPNNQLGSILVAVNCPELWLYNMDLSKENSLALVRAMRDRVELVELAYITMDIEELTNYDGRGCCRKLLVKGDMRTRHGDGLKQWAEQAEWTVTQDNDEWLVMERKS